MFQKIISALMAPLLLFFSLLPASLGARNDQTFNKEDLKQLHSLSDYIHYVEEKGVPSFSTDTFLNSFKPASTIRRILTGKIFSPEEEAFLDTTLDETLSDLCAYIADNSGLDVAKLIGHVPNLNGPAEFGAKVLHVNTTELREYFYALRDQADAEHDSFKANVLFLLGAYYSVIEKVDIRAVPTGRENEVRVEVTARYYDGYEDVMRPRIYINTETGEVTGGNNKGMMDLGFNFTTEELLVYATVGSWQRSFGFMLLYDILADSSPIFNYVTRRLKFDYAGKEWMVQMWKGNYALISNGAEVGVYNRAPGSFGTYYDTATDDELMEMTLEVWHGDEMLFDVGPMEHWWINGFKLSKALYQPKDLTIRFSMAVPDEAFLQALTNAIDNEGSGDITYTVDGLTITVTF